jgi:ACR3 family arsenite efflux pump ArsB
MMIGSIVERWDKHQIVLYLVAIAAGGAVGLTLPQIAPTLEHSIEPVLMLLLFATFLGVPLIEVGRAFPRHPFPQHGHDRQLCRRSAYLLGIVSVRR